VGSGNRPVTQLHRSRVSRSKWGIVEHKFAWASRNHDWRDLKRYTTTVAAFIHLAIIRIML